MLNVIMTCNIKMEITLFEEYFPKAFINQLTEDCNSLYSEYMRDSSGQPFNAEYFGPPVKSRWHSREASAPLSTVSDHFNHLLFEPNLYILSHILQNLNHFRDKIFLDNGSGIYCFLAILLRRLGITVYNYDDFSQIGEVLDTVFYKKYGVDPPMNAAKIKGLLEKRRIDGLFSCGIWVDNASIVSHDFEYLFLDDQYAAGDRECSLIRKRFPEFDLVKHATLGHVGVKFYYKNKNQTT